MGVASAAGPALPPHILAKRKRQREEETENAPTTPSGATRSPSVDGAEKRQRVVGPAMPPAPLEEMPSQPPARQEEDSDEDDDFGPALPSGVDDTADAHDDHAPNAPILPESSESAQQKLQRDEWMTMAPEQDNLAARMDPTKQRARAFNSGKGARGANRPSDGDSSAWHETPEQKRARLADEMMGVAKPSAGAPMASVQGKYVSHKVAAPNVAQAQARGPSLLEQHQQTMSAEVEDDPSQRAFDREKDMGSGGRISSRQKREMLNKAADFSSRFAGGGLL